MNMPRTHSMLPCSAAQHLARYHAHQQAASSYVPTSIHHQFCVRRRLGGHGLRARPSPWADAGGVGCLRRLRAEVAGDRIGGEAAMLRSLAEARIASEPLRAAAVSTACKAFTALIFGRTLHSS